MVKGLSLDDIIQEMYAMQSECSDVAYAIDNDEVIEDALGSEEEAYEAIYKMMKCCGGHFTFDKYLQDNPQIRCD